MKADSRRKVERNEHRPVPTEPETVARESVRPTPDHVAELLRSSGAPLETEDRAFFEPRLGHDFSRIRVHSDGHAARSADALPARAYTVGSDIVFGSGQYAPATSDGRRVLAHELAHTIQQSSATSGARQSPSAGQAFEREAHHIGNVVAAGGSASPALHTPHLMVQAFGSYEHQAMQDEAHKRLEDVLAQSDDVNGQCVVPTFGGVSPADMKEQRAFEEKTPGASHAPDLGPVSSVDPNARVAVPQLAKLLANDAFFRDRGRNLTLPLRNFQMKSDVAGPYLAIETNPVTKEVVRYDVHVSPGDMTALNGDLYGNMENLRRAPASEVLALQGVLDAEASWEKSVAEGKADAKNEPNFNAQWEGATAWREHKVYSDGIELGPEGSATGGDTDAYMGLARGNRAHFGQDTAEKDAIDVQVKTGSLETLAAGKQGNAASGNEGAWMSGHARALLLAREANVLKGKPVIGPMTLDQHNASRDSYGHETAVPPTGLVNQDAGNKLAPPTPKDQQGKALQRSAGGAATYESKLNDAYVENAGADHFLTDAYAAGHQIVREVIGTVTEQFVKNQGGRDAFLNMVVRRLQEGALKDPEKATGELGDFQELSHTWKDKAARGESWLNSKYNPLRLIGIGGDGLKQKLDKELNPSALQAIGAKLVHDYYNKRGLIAHNKKGMTFMVKGDGRADQAPEAQKIIALAVLESRNQITEMANEGKTPNPMDVWEYTPEFDKTAFTEASGSKVLEAMFQDSDYLWHLIKDNFSVATKKTDSGTEKQDSKNSVQKPMPGRGFFEDPGTPPLKTWLQRRQEYVKQHGQTPGPQIPGYPTPLTAEGLELPGAKQNAEQKRYDDIMKREDERERKHPWRGNRI